MINTQGALGLEYAAQGALLDLTPLFAREAAIKSRYDQNYLGNWVYEGKNYMVPFYITKTLLFYNKPMFAKAGLAGPPKNFDEILAFAQKMTSGEIASGFMTLNFDWLYWPLFAMNGVELLTPDLKKTAFNTPKAIEIVDKLAKATQSGAINKISWTGRWVEPNGAFGAGNVGMLHAHCAGLLLLQGPGQLGERRDAGRRADARHLRDAELARPRRLEGLEEPRARVGVRQVHHRQRPGRGARRAAQARHRQRRRRHAQRWPSSPRTTRSSTRC